MLKEAKPARDAFTFSLSGMTAITSFTAARAIAHDRLRQVRVDGDQKPSPMPTQPSFGRFWLGRLRRSRAAV